MADAPLRLVLLRHAKSSWRDPSLPDRDRPLNARGARTAPAVARELARRGWAPDAVLCSTAARARETWERMAPELPAAPFVAWRPDFYLGGIDAIRAALRALEPAFRTAWLVGHNPGWEHALAQLAGHRRPLKTADAALLRSHRPSWPAAVAPGARWELVDHLVARSVDPAATRS